MRFSFRRQRRFVIFLSTAAVFVLLLLTFQKSSPVVALMNGTRGAVSSVGAGVGSLLEHIFYAKADLIKENQRLTSAVAALTLDQAQADAWKTENDSLTALLGYRKKTSRAPLVARVMSRSNEILGQTILIDQGEHNGVALGDPVIVQDGLLVGTVVIVHPDSAVVRLLTDNQSKISVRLINADQTIGIADGQDGLLLSVGFIPQTVEVNVNTVLLTSGLDPGVPSGLVVGIVTSVQQDEHNPFQQAFVRPVIDSEHLSMVGVLSNTSL